MDAAGATDSMAHMDFADAIDSTYRADTVYATAPKVHEDVADAIDSMCLEDADDAIVPMEYNAAVLDACSFNSFSLPHHMLIF